VEGAVGPDAVAFGDDLVNGHAELREQFGAVVLEAGDGMFATRQATGAVVVKLSVISSRAWSKFFWL
jgi:hypothetical protein